jgi:hypothetical protein
LVDTKISELPVAGALVGTEAIPVVQGGATKKSTPSALATFVAANVPGLAPLASPAFTGNPTVPTASPGDNDLTIANTAFVTAAVGGGGVGGAPLASPAFTGNPSAPTPSPGDNDTSLATTAFVTAADVVVLAAAASSAATLYAPKASPVFTGNPTGPTPSPGDNDTSLATTAFVTAADVVVLAAAATAGNTAYAPKANAILTTPNIGAAVATSVAADTFTTTANNVNVQSGTSYTFQNSDNGKTVVFTSGSAVAAALNTGLTAGWGCSWIQEGAGQVTFGGTATLTGRNGKKSAGAAAGGGFMYRGVDTYFVVGDTTT